MTFRIDVLIVACLPLNVTAYLSAVAFLQVDGEARPAAGAIVLSPLGFWPRLF